MAETTNRDETTFDAKRKPDPCCDTKEEFPNKIQKLEVVDDDSLHDVKSTENGDHKQNAEVKDDEFEAVVGEEEADDDDEEENDYEDDDDEEEHDSDDGEKSSEKAAGDRKGKGIMKVDKGKGKLIEEDDDEDDSSDSRSDLDSDDTDLSDDPLAEVDLDNILPSRTRRRAVQPGVYIAKDLGNVDDDSNDSDA